MVDGQDHVDKHQGKLNQHSVVTGYRLWIPLDSSQEMQFLYAVSASVSPPAAITDHLTSRDISWFKRRRISALTDLMSLPDYAKAVTSITELTELIRLYYMGTRKVRMGRHVVVVVAG